MVSVKCGRPGLLTKGVLIFIIILSLALWGATGIHNYSPDVAVSPVLAETPNLTTTCLDLTASNGKDCRILMCLMEPTMELVPMTLFTPVNLKTTAELQ